MGNKLLSLNNYHYRRGGSDAVYLEHDRLFQEHQWETACFSMNHPDNIDSRWQPYFIDELEFGENYSVPQKIKMAMKVVYSFEAKDKITRLVNDFKPDIAHAHCIYHHLSPSVIHAFKDFDIPVVMTAHDLKLACPAYKMLNSTGVCEKCNHGSIYNLVKYRCIHNSLSTSSLVALESSVQNGLKIYQNNLSRIITPSKFYKNKLIEWGWDSHKIVYIPNYIDASIFQPDYEPGDYFIFFGRLAPEKGIKTLIKAAVKNNSRLLIIGTGPIEAELKAIAKDSPDIEFLGYKSGDELWDLVKHSRAIILPSEWYENAPVSLLESYALGKIVVGADIGGIPEMIIPDETGFIFQSGNVDALSDLLVKIIDMEDSKISDMGKHGREYVANTFTRDNYFNAMVELYSSLNHNIS